MFDIPEAVWRCTCGEKGRGAASVRRHFGDKRASDPAHQKTVLYAVKDKAVPGDNEV